MPDPPSWEQMVDYIGHRMDRIDSRLNAISDKLDERLRRVEQRVWWFTGAFTLAQFAVGLLVATRF